MNLKRLITEDPIRSLTVIGCAIVMLGSLFFRSCNKQPDKMMVVEPPEQTPVTTVTTNPEPVMMATATNVTVPQAERVTFRVKPQISFEPRPATTNIGHN